MNEKKANGNKMAYFFTCPLIRNTSSIGNLYNCCELEDAKSAPDRNNTNLWERFVVHGSDPVSISTLGVFLDTL